MQLMIPAYINYLFQHRWITLISVLNPHFSKYHIQKIAFWHVVLFRHVFNQKTYGWSDCIVAVFTKFPHFWVSTLPQTLNISKENNKLATGGQRGRQPIIWNDKCWRKHGTGSKQHFNSLHGVKLNCFRCLLSKWMKYRWVVITFWWQDLMLLISVGKWYWIRMDHIFCLMRTVCEWCFLGSLKYIHSFIPDQQEVSIILQFPENHTIVHYVSNRGWVHYLCKESSHILFCN